MVDPRGEKTFLLGVGCQKGGTAWMHRYLASSPQCDPGFRKEYHVFDGLDLASASHFRDRLMRRVRRAATAIERGKPADARNLQLASFYADPEAYYDYFESLLARDGVRLTADITPAYAQLSAERLAAIRDGFARRGIRVAPVFLMREPAERIWSAVRMYQQRKPERFPGPSEDRVLRCFDRPAYELRTRYELTMANLETVFGREQVFYGLYERLFEAGTLKSLCRFLGIDYHEPELGRRVNASPKEEAASLPEATARKVAEHYRATYEAVAARLRPDVVEQAWPGSRLLEPALGAVPPRR